MNSEVDINVLVGIYNQKISTLSNQNILLEAKIQTLIKDFEDEKKELLEKLKLLESSNKKSLTKKIEDFSSSEVD